MPSAQTYEPIATTTLGSTQSNYTFTSISQAYTDLILICTFASTGFNFSTQVGNGSIDSGSNYNVIRLYGTGSGAGASNYYTNDVYFVGNISANDKSSAVIHFNNYSNTTSYKTSLLRFNDAGAITFLNGGRWANTAAINQVRIFASSGALPAGSVFTLYGIKAA